MSLIRDLHHGIRTRYLESRAASSVGAFFLLATLVARYPVALAGDLDKVVLFDIQAQTLQSALIQFGVQAHVQLSVPVLCNTSTKSSLTSRATILAARRS